MNNYKEISILNSITKFIFKHNAYIDRAIMVIYNEFKITGDRKGLIVLNNPNYSW